MEKDITIEVHIEEDATNTLVHARLDLRGDHFEATGRSRRNPGDQSMPVIGEELALARALMTLQGHVLDAAQEKIARFLGD